MTVAELLEELQKCPIGAEVVLVVFRGDEADDQLAVEGVRVVKGRVELTAYGARYTSRHQEKENRTMTLRGERINEDRKQDHWTQCTKLGGKIVRTLPSGTPLTEQTALPLPLDLKPGSVTMPHYYHDDDCPKFRGTGECACDPHMAMEIAPTTEEAMGDRTRSECPPPLSKTEKELLMACGFPPPLSEAEVERNERTALDAAPALEAARVERIRSVAADLTVLARASRAERTRAVSRELVERMRSVAADLEAEGLDLGGCDRHPDWSPFCADCDP